MTLIYLDNSASTRPYGQVTELTGRVQDELYANPSALHEQGIAAERAIEEARRQVAALFRGRESEIVFTSGGTEANNLALAGAARRRLKRGENLVTTVIEHPSVLNCARSLKEEGFTVSIVPVDRRGRVDLGKLEEAVTADTILVSVMHVNNETGSISPLAEAGALVKGLAPRALFHVDAVQSLARLPLDVERWRADLVSCSAHKIHGPKGAGCLWVREGVTLKPLLQGGGQEKNRRPGTENTAAIAGFGLAAKLSAEQMAGRPAGPGRAKRVFLESLEKSSVKFSINGPSPEEAAPHIVNISFPGLKAEALLHALEERGVFVSAGSACHSRRPDPSHVLKAIGLGPDLLESALRFSFSYLNSEEEAAEAGRITAEVAGGITAFSRRR